MTVPTPRVRLVVLNYNGGTLVERCVEHLEALDWPADRLEIVVVDNASVDGSDARLAARPRVTLVRSPVNTGFPANNLGLQDLSSVDYVGLINNDAFVEPDYLHHLVAALEADPRLAAACPRIVLATRFLEVRVTGPTWTPPGDGRSLSVRLSGLEADGVDVLAAAGFGGESWPPEPGGPDEPSFRWLGGEAVVRIPADGPLPRTARLRLAAAASTTIEVDGGAGVAHCAVGTEPAWCTVSLGDEPVDVVNNVGSILIEGGWSADRGFLEADRGQFDAPEDVFAWCGAGVLFRPEYLRDVGLFDDRFFMYYEDTDLSWRGRSRGWRYRYVPAARMRHVHAATAVEGSAMFQHHVERNRLVMLTKNAPAGLVLRAAGRFVLSTASYARRDVVRPLLRARRPQPLLVWRRIRSFIAYLGLLPHALRERRRIRGARTVHDEAILGWTVRR